MAKKASAKKKAAPKKAKAKKAKSVKSRAKKSAKAKKIVARAKQTIKKRGSSKPSKPALPAKRRIEPETFDAYEPKTSPRGRGVGAGAAGQSGDIQGISRQEDVDSESVEELAEEGQDFEAEAVSGVENALDPDEGEVRTHEVPEDDVPREYDEQ
jgi:hypothetical protein